MVGDGDDDDDLSRFLLGLVTLSGITQCNMIRTISYSADIKNYRSISNLPVMSKVVERLVCQQLLHFLEKHNLLPKCQSAYRRYHSTETAVMKIISDAL